MVTGWWRRGGAGQTGSRDGRDGMDGAVPTGMNGPGPATAGRARDAKQAAPPGGYPAAPPAGDIERWSF
jgi:hypothetical protein